MRSALVSGGMLALVLATAPAAGAQAPVPGDPAAERAPAPRAQRAALTLSLRGVDDGVIDVGKRLHLAGRVYPFVPNQHVRILFKRGKTALGKATRKVKRVPGQNVGIFRLSSRPLVKPGEYRFAVRKPETDAQEGDVARTGKVRLAYPNLDPGDRGDQVKLFNELLRARGYHTSVSGHYGSATGRAVLAFRKVNNMVRTTNATARMFKTLAAGKGGFKLKWPGGGKHVEVDLSRQVMALAKNGKARHVFHISSGAPATPTIRGKTTFFRKQPGTNSRGMVHSVYFGPTNRGYATHGYASVPTYPASHGCVRNPIPNALFIYNWIDIGDGMYVYG